MAAIFAQHFVLNCSRVILRHERIGPTLTADMLTKPAVFDVRLFYAHSSTSQIAQW